MLCICLLALYGMHHRWPPMVVAVITGLGTATRSVGVALIPVFALYLIADCEARRGRLRHGCWITLWLRGIALIVLSCWGLAAFSLFQGFAFGDPQLFIKASALWYERHLGDAGGQLAGLLSLEPIRAVYSADSPCYWGRHAPHNDPLMNLYFWNPLYVTGAALLVGIGVAKRWLDRYEIVLSIGLLLIPYVMIGSRMCMTSQARYASIVFPAYIVLGRLLLNVPRALVCSGLIVSGALMVSYAVLFASWYSVL